MKEKKRGHGGTLGSLVALLLRSITTLFINIMGGWAKFEGRRGSLQVKGNTHGSLSNRCSGRTYCCKWVKFQFWENCSFIVRALFVSTCNIPPTSYPMPAGIGSNPLQRRVQKKLVMRWMDASSFARIILNFCFLEKQCNKRRAVFYKFPHLLKQMKLLRMYSVSCSKNAS